MSHPAGLPPASDQSDTPAVDHAGGVARLMGDASLFGRVLARFRKEYRQAGAGLRAALDGGDLATATRLAHTLKGAAGMIEAQPLRREAQRLEHLLHEGGDPGPTLARLRDELERVLRELDAIALTLPERPPTNARIVAPATRVDGEDAVEKLVTLLDEGNGDALDLVRDGAGALVARLGPDLYLQVAQAVESFDFDGALATLRQAGAQGLAQEQERTAG